MEYFTEENVYSKIGKRVRVKRVIFVWQESTGWKKLPKGTLGKVTGVKVKDFDSCFLYRISIEWQTRSLPPLKRWFIERKIRSSTPLSGTNGSTIHFWRK
jgi:hypothetical protein